MDTFLVHDSRIDKYLKKEEGNNITCNVVSTKIPKA